MMYSNKAACLSLGHFHPSLAFADKAAAYQWLHSEGCVIVLPTNIRLGWKRLTAISTQAKYSKKKNYSFMKLDFLSGKTL